MSTVDEKKQDEFTSYSQCKMDFCFDKCNRKKYNMKTCK